MNPVTDFFGSLLHVNANQQKSAPISQPNNYIVSNYDGIRTQQVPVVNSTPQFFAPRASAPAPTNNSAPTNTNTGGGGGGGGGGGQSQPSTYFDPSTGQTFGSYAQFQDAINQAYQPSFDYLNQAENTVRADYPNAQAEAQANYNTNAAQLGVSRQGAFDTLDNQQTQATHGKEDAMASARRIFQEQQIGANQRFGGASSAGGALSELQSRSLAEQQGKTGRQYTDISQQIGQQHNNIEQQYQANLLGLEQQKQSAIDAATRDFNNKLLQISQNRAQVGQAKADANLAALTNLRNQVFQIQLQTQQFQQQLAAQREQAAASLGAYNQQINGATNSTGQLIQNPYATYNATYGANGQSTGGADPNQQLTGQISTGSNQDPNFLQGILGNVAHTLVPSSKFLF